MMQTFSSLFAHTYGLLWQYYGTYETYIGYVNN